LDRTTLAVVHLRRAAAENPFKIDRRTLLAGVAGLAVGTALGYIAGRPLALSSPVEIINAGGLRSMKPGRH
jgi:hypothetical protein